LQNAALDSYGWLLTKKNGDYAKGCTHCKIKEGDSAKTPKLLF
jgi:hypothetical protein